MECATIIDSLMGSGKTTAMITHVNLHEEKNYLFITPFLGEIDRIKAMAKVPFFDPVNHGNGKLDNLKYLLSEGRNIAATHSLFLMADNETEDLIKTGGYTLILDETLDVVSPYNAEYPANAIKRGDISLLLQKGLISVDDYGIVAWTDYGCYDDFNYAIVEKLARAGNLICIGNELFLCQFPARIFALFDDVYVMTYQFEGTILRSYFDYYGIPYRKKSASSVGNGYEIVDFIDDKEQRKVLKPLIHIYDDTQIVSIGKRYNALSKAWYRNASKDAISQVRKNCNLFLKNRVPDVKSERVMWTVFKDRYKDIVGNGYKYIRRIGKEDRAIPEREFNKLKCFVACNSRATNNFAERDVLMYLVNRFPDPEIGKFFAKKGVGIDNEMFALNEMLQWIWRSAIRNRQEIHLYIPSSRMRNLLLDWLDGKR